MKKKSFIAILLIAVLSLVLLFAACNKKQEEVVKKSKVKPPSLNNVTLKANQEDVSLDLDGDAQADVIVKVESINVRSTDVNPTAGISVLITNKLDKKIKVYFTNFKYNHNLMANISDSPLPVGLIDAKANESKRIIAINSDLLLLCNELSIHSFSFTLAAAVIEGEEEGEKQFGDLVTFYTNSINNNISQVDWEGYRFDESLSLFKTQESKNNAKMTQEDILDPEFAAYVIKHEIVEKASGQFLYITIFISNARLNKLNFIPKTITKSDASGTTSKAYTTEELLKTSTDKKSKNVVVIPFKLDGEFIIDNTHPITNFEFEFSVVDESTDPAAVVNTLTYKFK